MIARVLSFLTDHPPAAALAIALCGAGVGAATAWHLKKCPEAVHLEDHSHYEDDLAELVQVHRVEGPERVVVRRYAVPAAGCSGTGPLVEESETDRGPSSSDATTARSEHATADRKLDLTVTPAPRPGWELQVGTEDLLSLRSAKVLDELRLAGRRRLLGPTWGEISTKPLHRCDDGRWCPTVGAAVAIEFP